MTSCVGQFILIGVKHRLYSRETRKISTKILKLYVRPTASNHRCHHLEVNATTTDCATATNRSTGVCRHITSASSRQNCAATKECWPLWTCPHDPRTAGSNQKRRQQHQLRHPQQRPAPQKLRQCHHRLAT